MAALSTCITRTIGIENSFATMCRITVQPSVVLDLRNSDNRLRRDIFTPTYRVLTLVSTPWFKPPVFQTGQLQRE